MKRHYMSLVAVLAVSVLANWSGQENTSNTKKNRVNFYGTLETHAGNIFNVDNISIAHAYKQVKVYEVPAQYEKNQPRVMLKHNPKEGIVTMIDLKESTAIEAESGLLFLYKKKKGSREVEFVKITITSKDKARTKNSYLIETTRKLICDEINEAGPIEKEVPFNAIKKLTLEGWKFREDLKEDEKENKSDNNKKTNAPTKEFNEE